MYKRKEKINGRKPTSKYFAVQLLLIFTVIITSIFFISKAKAAGITNDGLYSYVIRNEKAEITLTEDGISNKSLIIPGKVNKYEVSSVNLSIYTSVSESQIKTDKIIFNDLDLKYNSDTSQPSLKIIIPAKLKENIREVLFMPNCKCSIFPPGYFVGYTAMESISLPEGITTIGRNAFFNCTQLKEIALPDSLILLENNCFNTFGKIEKIYYNYPERFDMYSEDQIGTDFNSVNFVKRKDISLCNIKSDIDTYVLSVSDSDTQLEEESQYIINTDYINNRSLLTGIYEYYGRKVYNHIFTTMTPAPNTEEPVNTICPENIYPTNCPIEITKSTDKDTVYQYIYIKESVTPLPSEDAEETKSPMLDDKKIVPKPVKNIVVKNNKKNIYVKWSNSNKSYQYEIFRKIGKGKYKKLCEVSSYYKGKGYYKDKYVKKGYHYTYRIRAKIKVNKIIYYSAYKKKQVKV